MAHIEKRKNTYKVTTDFRQNGKRIRKSKEIINKQSAEEFKSLLDEIEKYIKENKIKLTGNENIEEIIQIVNSHKNRLVYTKYTFSEWLDYWLENRKHGVNSIRDNTADYYSLIIEVHIKPALGKILLTELTEFDIQDYYNYLYEEKKESASSIKKHHAILSNSIKMAYKRKYIPQIITDFVELPAIQKFKKKVYDQENAIRLLKVMLASSIKIPVILALCCGLRRSEICGANWKYTDFDKKTTEIKNVVVKVNGEWKIVFNPKTKDSDRLLLLPNIVIEFLILWKKEQNETRKKYGAYATYNDLICTMPDGRMIKPDYITRTFKKILKENNLPIIRFQDLRGTFSSLLLEEGANIYYLAEYLGHSNIQTTQKSYAQTLPKGKLDLTKKIDDIFQEIKKTM